MSILFALLCGVIGLVVGYLIGRRNTLEVHIMIQVGIENKLPFVVAKGITNLGNEVDLPVGTTLAFSLEGSGAGLGTIVVDPTDQTKGWVEPGDVDVTAKLVCVATLPDGTTARGESAEFTWVQTGGGEVIAALKVELLDPIPL